MYICTKLLCSKTDLLWDNSSSCTHYFALFVRILQLLQTVSLVKHVRLTESWSCASPQARMLRIPVFWCPFSTFYLPFQSQWNPGLELSCTDSIISLYRVLKQYICLLICFVILLGIKHMLSKHCTNCAKTMA